MKVKQLAVKFCNTLEIESPHSSGCSGNCKEGIIFVVVAVFVVYRMVGSGKLEVTVVMGV